MKTAKEILERKEVIRLSNISEAVKVIDEASEKMFSEGLVSARINVEPELAKSFSSIIREDEIREFLKANGFEISQVYEESDNLKHKRQWQWILKIREGALK